MITPGSSSKNKEVWEMNAEREEDTGRGDGMEGEMK